MLRLRPTKLKRARLLPLLSPMSSSSAPASPVPGPSSASSTPPPSQAPFPTPPQLAKLPSLRRSSSSKQTFSPLFLDNLTRATLPSSSVSDATARFPDLSKPAPAKLERTLSGTSIVSPARGGNRARSASIGSLKSFVESGAVDREALTRRRSSAKSIGSIAEALANGHAAPEEAQEEASVTEDRDHASDAALSQLRWGSSWWPFEIVKPDMDDSKGKGKALPPIVADGEERTSRRSSRGGFMELFTGRGAFEASQARLEQERMYDEAEGELLDTDLDALRIASTSEGGSSSFSQYLEADDGPPPSLPSKNNSPRPDLPSKDHTPTFLSSPMFTSTSASSPPPKPLEGPSSIFSSFSITNPFTGSSKSASNSPTQSLSSSPSNNRPHYGRSYSNGPHGKGTKRKEVDEFLDEEDKKAAKMEDDSHMDMFTLIKERYNCPKYPIVFCHGLFGFDYLGPANIKPLQFSYWVGVKEALEAIGVEVLIGRVPASASIEERAKVLCELIETTFPGREVNLIGHSMGGLDARFLISRLKPTTFKVRSLTSIATPHRGSSFADYLLEDILGADRIPTLLGVMSSFGVPGGGKAFDDLTTTKMARFNEETPDDPNVRYFSYGAQFVASWSNPFRISWGIVLEREGPNDGLVSVESSKWGDYKATLYNVNHLDLIGMVGKVRYSWAEWTGKPIKFKPISFYSTIAEMLADEGL